MYCPYCGMKRERRGACSHCGRNPGKNHTPKWAMLLTFCVLGAAFLFVWIGTDYLKSDKPTFAGSMQVENSVSMQDKEMFVLGGTDVKDGEEQETQLTDAENEQETDLTEVIAEAQETVYTVYSSVNQGSGFLYNDEGAVVTNAHVVEGSLDVFVETKNGEEYQGTVIGYSNETDVALIDVPGLAGVRPSEMELEDNLQIGEEVIALGSPLDLENTATMGFLTGKNRNFVLDPYVYEDVFQISAMIAPGSSGGPLVSRDSAKIIGINSAKNQAEDSIGFSIPLFKVSGLIQEWLESPMSEEDILIQFYDAYGDYYFDGLWEDDDGYFDGGEYSEDDFYDEYEEYDEDYWDDFDEDYDDGYEFDEEEDDPYGEYDDEDDLFDDDYDDDWNEDFDGDGTDDDGIENNEDNAGNNDTGNDATNSDDVEKEDDSPDDEGESSEDVNEDAA